MDIIALILLILFGLLFLVVEILLLPGVSVGGILAAACYGTAIYLSFANHSVAMGVSVTIIIIAVSTLAIIWSLKAKTWRKLALNQKITSSSNDLPEQKNIKIGDQGTTLSRLSPMGKIQIAGDAFEAKSQGEYIDQRQEVEVVGFENFTVIVKQTQIK